MVDNFKDRSNIITAEELKKDLLSRPVPALLTEQLDLFKFDDIHTKPVARFNFEKLPHFFENNQGTAVLALDLGGNKAEAAKVIVSGNGFTIDKSTVKKFVGDQGKGHLDFLEEISQDEGFSNLPVGISTAGVVKGTILAESPCGDFYKDFNDRYGRDFAKLFPHVLSLNDAVAGLISGIIKTNELFPKAALIIYEINGGGLGVAVLLRDTIWATEAGHTKAISAINPFRVDKICRLYPQNGICVENLSVSGAFIEDYWQKLTNEKLDGREIEKKYYQGDARVANLYDASAWGLAHALVGTGNVWSLWNNPEEVAVVLHGGGFKAPGVPERVMQIIEKHFGKKFNYVTTHSYSNNACLEGAGIAKLLTDNSILEQI